jgi:catechol 2,3-dioxygenase-like lactoylglutathione lyase family enzyme
MLANKTALATVAVKDLTAAARFYEEKLGLKRVHTEGEEAISYQTGSTQLVVYRSQYASTNKATSVTWNVGDELENIVRTLKEKGVPFERYENLPGLTLEGDIHTAGAMKLAWFKDPDGNIHHIMNA